MATVGLSSFATADAQETKKAADQPATGQPGAGQPGARGATLTLTDTGESKATPVSISSAAFRQRVSIQIEAPKAGGVLHVEAGPLNGPDGVSADLSATLLGRTGRSIDVPIEASTTAAIFDIELSANLTRAGEYSGYVSLRYGDERTIIRPVRVTRSFIDVPVELLGVERVPARSCLSCWREAVVLLNLQGPLDRDLVIVPTLAELALTRSGKERLQASVGSQAITAAGSAATGGVALKAGETRQIEIKLDGLGSTGEYAGKVRIASSGFKPKDHAFVLLVKDAWWIAVIPIILGAAASMWLKRYGSDKRPRLVVRQRLARLGEQIDALRSSSGRLDEAESQVLDALTRRLARLYGEATSLDKLPDGWSSSAQAALKSVALKIDAFPSWANARRSVTALDPGIDTGPIKTRLTALQAAFEADTDLTEAQRTELSQLPSEIGKLRKDTTLATAKALQDQVEALRKVVRPDVLLDPGWKKANDALENARNHAAAGEFAASLEDYEIARFAFSGLLLRDLSGRVAEGTPVGLDTQKWSELKPQVERQLELGRQSTEARGALDGYARAYSLYLNAQIGAILPRLLDEPRIDKLAQKLGEKGKEFRDLAAATAEALRDAGGLLARNELHAAYAKHVDALAGWKKLSDLVATVGDRMGGAAPLEAGTASLAPAAQPPEPAGHPSAHFPTVFGRVVESAAQLEVETKARDLIIDILAIVIAAVLGVQFVWGSNPTWGSLSDWLAALLWGLGLHQVSGITFEGVLGLREKLIK